MSFTKSVLPTCSQVRANGQICQGLAVTGSRFCYFHSKTAQRRRITHDMLAVRRSELTDRGRKKPPAHFDEHSATLFEHLDLPPIEDATSAVTVLNTVVQANTTQQLSSSRAHVYLRAVGLYIKLEALLAAEKREPKYHPKQSATKLDPRLYNPFLPNITMDTVTETDELKAARAAEAEAEWKKRSADFVPMPDVRDLIRAGLANPDGTEIPNSDRNNLKPNAPNSEVALDSEPEGRLKVAPHEGRASDRNGGLGERKNPSPVGTNDLSADSKHPGAFEAQASQTPIPDVALDSEPEGRLKVAPHGGRASDRNGGLGERKGPSPVGTTDSPADSTLPEAFENQASQTPKEISPARKGGVGGVLEVSSPLQRAAQPPDPAQPRAAVPHDPSLRGEKGISRNQKPETRNFRKVASTGRIDLYEAEPPPAPGSRVSSAAVFSVPLESDQ